jgi:hypothetical protein
LVDCFVLGCIPSRLIKRYGTDEFKQCEPVERLVIGESYQWKEVGLYSGPGCHKAQAIVAESVISRPAVKLITIPSTYRHQDM